MSYEKSRENWTIQKLSPGFMLLLTSNIILQESYKDSYDDCCSIYNGCATVSQLQECYNVKQKCIL